MQDFKTNTNPMADKGGYSQGQIGETITMNIGPSHPSTHGVLRLKTEFDGDMITKVEPVVGYLHRGQEKIAENLTYNQFVPFTDRLDYLASMCNNIAFVQCAEKLAGIDATPRCKAVRVICCELSRIASHLVGLAAYAMDAGSTTGFMYCFTQREKILTLFEALTGARMTASFARVGGMARDLPDGWLGSVNVFLNQFAPALEEIDKLITRNRIFIERTEGIGVVTAEQAMQYGFTGPNLRGSGIDTDLRKTNPYLGYENYDFDVPIGTHGDAYDRWLVRLEEMRQSSRIVRQAMEKMPDGPINIDDPKIVMPRKDKVLTSMEELIHNFTVATQGPDIPKGEAYFEADNPKGALGFYIMSMGGGVPYRVKIRAPSFVTLSALQHILPGHHNSDITVVLGSLDFVLGECDR